MSSEQSFPGDMMKIDFVGQFSGSMYPYVLTEIDIFTKYLFAEPLTSPSAAAVAKAFVSIFFQHSYIPETILTDLGTTSFYAWALKKLGHKNETRFTETPPNSSSSWRSTWFFWKDNKDTQMKHGQIGIVTQTLPR